MLTGISGSKTVFKTATTRSSMPSDISGPFLVGGDRAVAALERGFHRVPGERRALDPHRVLAHAGEDCQLAEVGVGASRRRGRLGDEAVEAGEEVARLRDGLALERVGHQRGGGGRDRAAAAFKRDVPDHLVLDVEIEGDLVAAQRVVALRPAVRRLERAEVPWPPVMVEDD